MLCKKTYAIASIIELFPKASDITTISLLKKFTTFECIRKGAVNDLYFPTGYGCMEHSTTKK